MLLPLPELLAVVVSEPSADRTTTVVNAYELCWVRSLASARCVCELELPELDESLQLELESALYVLEPT